jgi:hypothetical protein
MPTAKTTLNPAYGQLKICLPNELRLDDPISSDRPIAFPREPDDSLSILITEEI